MYSLYWTDGWYTWQNGKHGFFFLSSLLWSNCLGFNAYFIHIHRVTKLIDGDTGRLSNNLTFLIVTQPIVKVWRFKTLKIIKIWNRSRIADKIK